MPAALPVRRRHGGVAVGQVQRMQRVPGADAGAVVEGRAGTPGRSRGRRLRRGSTTRRSARGGRRGTRPWHRASRPSRDGPGSRRERSRCCAARAWRAPRPGRAGWPLPSAAGRDAARAGPCAPGGSGRGRESPAGPARVSRPSALTSQPGRAAQACTRVRNWPGKFWCRPGAASASLRLSSPAFCTGLSRYSITRRLPVLISAVTFIPGARSIRLPSTSMRRAARGASVAGKMAPRFSSLTASAVTLFTLASIVP